MQQETNKVSVNKNDRENELFFTLGMTRRASANAWTPSWALPFTLGLCFTRASATATSKAPAPETTLPEDMENKEIFRKANKCVI